MIARLIAASARNLMLVLIGTVFAVAAGIYAILHLPLDAIPDLSDTQVIVYTEYPGQAPQVVEDQVTYPLTTAMLTVPRSRVVRGFSYFGVSFVYVIFEDGTDIYWARSRVLEYLNAATRRLPSGVTPTLGPDATGVGWVYQYALLAKDRSLAELRSLQDWYVRYGLAKAEGVAEIASVGGFVKQYNVVIDPQRLRSFDIPLSKVRDAVRSSNMDVGGRTVELSEFEYVVRGRGYLKGLDDLKNIVLKNDGGTPVLVRDVARVELGPDERRGLTELNGDGEVASGIVLQRFGANALDVIDSVKKRIGEIAGSLPKGVEIVAVYDRSTLIHAAIETLRQARGGKRRRRAGVRHLLVARAQRARRDPDAAGGRTDGLCRHEGIGPRLQHHEPGGDRHRHRRHGRCGDRHDRERPQAPRTRRTRQAAAWDSHCGGERGRPGLVLQPADHHGLVPADLLA
jgi:Cu(I)/Ag(I) efflux system membrane protein CusA/SilA